MPKLCDICEHISPLMALAGGCMGGLRSDRKQIRGRKPLGYVRYLLHGESCVVSFCLTLRTNCVRIVFGCRCKVVTRVKGTRFAHNGV